MLGQDRPDTRYTPKVSVRVIVMCGAEGEVGRASVWEVE